MGSLWQRLRERKLVQWAVAYVAAAWAALQVVEMAAGSYGWPTLVMRIAFGVVALGFVVTLLLAWYHGERGQQKVSGTELLLLSLVLAVGGALIWRANLPSPAPPQARADAASTDAGSVTPAPGKSIAVLPFTSMSSNVDDGYFADGLSEEIINSLSRVPDLQVSARTSSFALRDSGLTVPAIASKLHVATVLEGSVRRAGDRLRITAQLIRAMDGFELWSETYDRSSDDVIVIQEDVARSIAQALQTATDPEALAAMQRVGTRSVPAYDAYLKGLALQALIVSRGTGKYQDEAAAAFDRALAIDPDFAEAHVQAVAIAHGALNPTNFNSDQMQRAPYARRLANFRRKLDAALASRRGQDRRDFYLSLGAMVDLHFREALRLTRSHLETHPKDYEALSQLATLALYVGEPTLVRQASERMHALADNATAQSEAMIAMTRVPDLDRATRMARDALRRFPGNTDIAYQAQRVLLTAGRVQEAAALLPGLLSSEMKDQGKFLVRLRQACAEGRVADAQDLVARFDLESTDPSVPWHAYLLLGRVDEAYRGLAEMDRAEELYPLAGFMTYPKFDPGRFPALRTALAADGIAIRAPRPEPYDCRTPGG